MDGTNQNKNSLGSRLIPKVALIVAQLLLLLVPAFYIKLLVLERQSLQTEAVEEITGHWAGRQQVTGPVLKIPYIDTSGGGSQRKMITLLPDSLSINGDLQPRERHRGIYEVMLYETNLNLDVVFGTAALADLNLDSSGIIWGEAMLLIQMGDRKGLVNAENLLWNGQAVRIRSGQSVVNIGPETLAVPVRMNSEGINHFSGRLTVRGAGEMLLSTIGNTNHIQISSPWEDPSFRGEQLPQYQVDKAGFRADWKILSHQQIHPQAWKDGAYTLQSEAVGVDLFIPVNRYQQVLRSVKYAALVIILSFVAFFLIETISRQQVNALSYGLVGAALVIFYSLLLALSEHISFAASYWTATVATVALVGWFTNRLLSSQRWSSIMTLTLGLLYAYLFSLLQLEDYSLLLGSIGLFIALAITMGVATRLLKTNGNK